MAEKKICRSLRAGVAKSDITTDSKDAVIQTPLFAKVLVLDDGKTRVVVIAMDTTAIGGRKISCGLLPDVSDEFLPNLRCKIEKELNIPGHNVLVNASHTHPPGRLLCDDEQQVERTFEAIRRAVENLQPVTVGAGKGYENRITMNRTLRLKNGKHWTIRHTNPSPPDKEVADVGPIDPEIGVLRIDRADGSPLAVVYNFASHPLFGDLKGGITANFPAVASNLIEETLGNGAMAIFLQGTGGDIIDIYFKDFNRPRNIETIGMMLGLSTLRAWRDITPTDAKISVISETIEFPRRTDIPERIRELENERAALLESLQATSLDFKTFLPLYIKYSLNPDYPADSSYRYLQEEKIGIDELSAMDAFVKRQIDKYLDNTRAMEKLARIQDKISTLRKHQRINDESGEATISAEVMGIKIGEFVLISSPAEVLLEIGLNIKKASPYEYTFISAFSNGYLHYGPPAEYYEKGGYEVTECLLDPQWQKIYETRVSEILHALG